MSFQNTLLKIGLLDLNTKRMKHFIDESEVEMIKWAYENGKYDVRLLAVQFFEGRDDNEAVLFLAKGIEDSTEIISQTAMSALEKLVDSEEINQTIAEKRQFWLDENEYRDGRRNRTHLKSSVLSETKEQGSKKTLDNVRNMLKKPINGGKWF